MLVYEDVFKALNRARIKYIVAGGVAVVLHGFPRYTGDLDLMVYLEKGNLGRFFDALGKLGFLPKVPVRREEFQDERARERWRTEKNMVVFSFQNRKPPFRLVDMFVEEPIRFPDVERKAVRVRYGTTRIPLMAIEHLVLLKDAAGRGKDLEDIVQLKAIQERRDEEKAEKVRRPRKA